MSPAPKITIVIPMRNAETYIRTSLLSCLHQLLPGDEIIVVDDGSIDHSVNIVSSMANKQLRVFQQPQQGVAACRHFGNLQAKGEFILPLDADDELTANSLAIYRQAMRQHPTADVFYGHCAYIRADGSLQYIQKYPRIISQWLALVWVMSFPRVACKHSSSLYRRQIYMAVGGYDLSFQARVDVELALNFISKGVKIVRIDEVVARYRKHSRQMSLMRVRNFKYWVKVIFKYEANKALATVWVGLRAVSELAKFMIQK